MAPKIDALNRELRGRVKAGQPNIWGHGNGLSFVLAKGGRASWGFRFTLDGKRRLMTLAPFRDAIAERDFKALEIHAIELRDMVKAGIDPLAQRRRAVNAKAVDNETFREIAESYIESQRPGWKNPKHAEQWVRTLAEFVYPHIGAMQPHEIGIEDVLRVLRQPHKRRNSKTAVPLWDAVPETASRVRMRIEKVISAAKSRGIGNANRDIRARWHNHINPARWEDGLEHWLTNKKQSDAHFAALPYHEVPAIISVLLKKSDFSSRALALTILTGVRTSEALQAEWNEIDLDAAVWSIPAERMKGGRPHRVPLSTKAIEILKRQPRFQDSEFVFPGARRGKPLSNMAMLQVIRGMKGHGITVHGFRSSLRDWITDTTIHPNEVAEAALAHSISNKTEAAYRRGEILERRAILMQQWCDYLTLNSDKYKEIWTKYIAI